MRSDVNAIAVGYAGKLSMFEAIGYIKLPEPIAEEQPPEKKLREVFDSVFG